ncbi:hypothetical protein HID58_084266 [Brassica napus]|uniref:(rape) hypothetical protein n=1 Tax=Brassica napus TaxID=3708 RepID=A0A816IRN6_BRANA|nr:F-box protein At3g27290 [Brassica napus]KAH0856005.1 hypothetical protein HID58_084266 [Brassica napus]CAF1715584.1 unnamed protein product [Brassica napus]
MEISCGALGDVDRLREDDLFKTVSFSGYQTIVSWAWDGGDSSNGLFSDLLSFGEEINALAASLPEDPFSMNIRSTLNSLGEEAATLPNDPFCMTLKDHKVSVLGGGGGEEPHSAFDLVLPYLEMRDAFAVESVCRSLRDSVRKESCLWTTVDLSDDSLLKYRVTDDSLLKLTRRAQGRLRCLNLGGCVGITDDGLMQVLASNPRLSKLSVSGCHRLSTVGLLSTLRDLRSSNQLGVKSLVTGGALYFTREQFNELNLLLGADGEAGSKSRRRRLYTSCRSDFSLDDDRGTDLEICPWCEKPSLVFDCASETCPLKDHPCPKQSCRACVVCIERCHDCGSCLNDCEHKPFCFAFSCVICYKKRSNQLQELL